MAKGWMRTTSPMFFKHRLRGFHKRKSPMKMLRIFARREERGSEVV
jgi:hypothetical protein